MVDTPHARGVKLAILAALSFGVTTPLVARAGIGLGPFTTGALLYMGASGAGFAFRRLLPSAGHPLTRHHAWRVLGISLLGALMGPALLAFALQRTGATSASLVLNLEAILTLILARVIWHEPLGGRAWAAATFMLAGGVALVLEGRDEGADSLIGLVAVGLATLAWALDNTLSRSLSEAEPLAVVGWKGLSGASLAVVIAVALGEPLPAPGPAAALLGLGAVGYGGSLALYLMAQRALGAGRTGSVFALGPFVGAVVALALGDRQVGLLTAVAGALFALGVVLHLREQHAHAHLHEALEHDHAHRHDDDHHDHVHDPPVRGSHRHPHRHARVEHDHPHAPDLHHRHTHRT